MTAIEPPPTRLQWQLQSFNDPLLAGYAAVLWAQTAESGLRSASTLPHPALQQPVRWHDLDYAVLQQWLALALSQPLQAVGSLPGRYAMMLATRIYGESGSASQQQTMLDFAATHFSANPAAYWPWLVHAVYVAQHQFGKTSMERATGKGLARQYANQLRHAPAEAKLPHWARQLEVFILEDLGEIETAKVLLGGMLAAGEWMDQRDFLLMSQRLRELENHKPMPAGH
ncbi:hypothetical protein DU000_10850 [Parvibium lacunae]|uniref:Uncharacterized protein n=2 Tax=Parvibium lacunae TaxID=1888893 RepID=A0A368L0L4_9BURK|nr:hypothetical protein DU000_10850 [Parvibium lacunae]